jgi:hypothetical protein
VDPKPREIEVEVLPAAGKEGRSLPKSFPELIAWIMDECLTIPGTKVKFGLDPVLGLLPGLGDGASSIASIAVLLQAANARVPRIVLIRMALNILINAAIGAIPGVGDLFSIWFKSNVRNKDLLAAHAGGREASPSDWWFVATVVGGVILAVAFFILAAMGLVVMLFRGLVN